MNQYFAQLERIIALKNTSHRIRFKIQDIIDLRKVLYNASSRQYVDPGAPPKLLSYYI